MSEKLPKLNVRLLRKVQKHILAEPKRLNMTFYGDTVDPNYPGNPECGTVGCIAGWTDMLTLGYITGGCNRARKSLGLSNKEFPAMFFIYKCAVGKGGAREVSSKIDLLIRDRKAFVKKWSQR